jgi:hypothetical protein
MRLVLSHCTQAGNVYTVTAIGVPPQFFRPKVAKLSQFLENFPLIRISDYSSKPLHLVSNLEKSLLFSCFPEH